MARIKIPSPVIDEAVKETNRLERIKKKELEIQKDKKRWERYKKYLSYLQRKHSRVLGGLNTTK